MTGVGHGLESGMGWPVVVHGWPVVRSYWPSSSSQSVGETGLAGM